MNHVADICRCVCDQILTSSKMCWKPACGLTHQQSEKNPSFPEKVIPFPRPMKLAEVLVGCLHYLTFVTEEEDKSQT